MVPLGHVVRKETRGKNGADADHRNWKQCAWRSADGRDIGLIKVGMRGIKINLCIVNLIFAQFYFHIEHTSNYCNVKVNKKVGSGENTLCPVWNQIFIHVLAIVFCRIVSSTRGKVIPLSVLFTRATFI